MGKETKFSVRYRVTIRVSVGNRCGVGSQILLL